jgi:zinc transporter 1
MRAVFLHVLGDALGSVGVIVSGLVITYAKVRILVLHCLAYKCACSTRFQSGGEYRFIVDPLCSLAIVVLILYHSVPLFRQAVGVLLQGTPSLVSVDSLSQKLLKIDGVLDVHDMHIWQLDGRSFVTTLHLSVEPSKQVAAVNTV